MNVTAKHYAVDIQIAEINGGWTSKKQFIMWSV